MNCVVEIIEPGMVITTALVIISPTYCTFFISSKESVETSHTFAIVVFLRNSLFGSLVAYAQFSKSLTNGYFSIPDNTHQTTFRYHEWVFFNTKFHFIFFLFKLLIISQLHFFGHTMYQTELHFVHNSYVNHYQI